MEATNIPLSANWNLISSTAACPDGGFLYIGFKSVNYISAIKQDENPVIKAIPTRQKIKSIDCDHDWSDMKYFAALADDNTIQVWDVNDGKAKKGHKAHIKTSIGDGDGLPSETVAMCFVKNRTIFSIDSSCIVKYCVNSNRYTKTKRVIANKYKINIVKASPYDENLMVFGSTRGLIFLVNITSESIVSTFCGHSREITSFSWIANSVATRSRPIKTPVRQRVSRKSRAAPNATADDIFDIYDFDYLENEFGAPARLPSHKVVSDAENTRNDPTGGGPSSNEHFNFIEACKSLKDDILARKDDEICNDSITTQEKQVTLEDCQQALHDREASGAGESFDCDSELSVEFPDSSEDSLLDDFQNNCTINSTMEQSVLEQGNIVYQDIYLASGSIDGTVCVWNIKSSESIDQIVTKGPQTHNNIEVAWLNSKTLVMNDKSCELAIYVGTLTEDKKYKFKREKNDSKQRHVVGVCKMINSEIVWTLSSRRELICENAVTSEVLARYSCAVTGATAIQENPGDMNRIAIAFPDRRISLMSLGTVSSKCITMENWTFKEDLQIISLCWCPNYRFLAFGSAEGRVGVIDTEKPSSSPVLMKPLSGKPVYSMAWSDNKIVICSQDKLAFYEWNGKAQHATKLDLIDHASSILLHGNLLLVGCQNGDLRLYIRSDKSSFDFKLCNIKNLFSKYINEISLNPLNGSLVAVSANGNKIEIIKVADTNIELERTLVMESTVAGNACGKSIKWSNRNEHLLVSCGFDGTVRIWDISRPIGTEQIYLKQFDSPMLCAVFSPINEDIVLCAGRATSIEMFNYKTDAPALVTKTLSKKNKNKHLGEVQWGTRLENAVPTKKKSKHKAHDVDTGESNAEMIERLNLIKGEDNGRQDNEETELNIAKHPATIFHILAKELNKDILQTISKLLEDCPGSSLIIDKLFGSRKDAEDILYAEMKNHEASNTKSIGRILIPQFSGCLKEEILECIKSKKLNDMHVSLAPTISYDFWRKCCKAYASQLLEVGLVLNAASYFLACHEVRETINHLTEKHYYREAWIIAKVHIDSKDPIFDTLFNTWVQYVYSTGNYESAALLYILAGDLKNALACLSERRQPSDEHRRLISVLESDILNFE